MSVKITRVSEREAVPDDFEMPVMLSGGSDDFESLDYEQMEFGQMDNMVDVPVETELRYTREILVIQTEEGIFLRFPIKKSLK